MSAGTDNSDEARDFDLPLKNRFYLQPLPPAQAAVRAKESAQDILNLKPLIDKKQWPYVMNDLRLRASYLRYDLKTVISSKTTKEEKKDLKDLTGKLFATLDGVRKLPSRSFSYLMSLQKHGHLTASNLNIFTRRIAGLTFFFLAA